MDKPTAKEIYEAAQRLSVGCPCCGGRLILTWGADALSDIDADALLRAQQYGQLELVPVEEEAHRAVGTEFDEGMVARFHKYTSDRRN